MNADGSKPVSADVEFSVKIPMLSGIGNILLAMGLCVMLVGGAIIYATRR
jgi:hypothetical protein